MTLKVRTSELNIKPALYFFLGTFVMSIWTTDNMSIWSMKLLLSGLIIISSGFFYDTFHSKEENK